MRFMMIVKATKASEAGILPGEELIAAMARYNEELMKAGVFVDATGLQPSSKGARVKFSGEKRIVIDGPFPETKDLIAGYWLIQVKSKEEAIEWAKRCPNPHPGEESEIEIRQLFELEDFGTSAAVEHHRELAKEFAKKKS
ncbi:MAG TPA: YciI family protein [Alphaproteobacteria bacterium]